jgi:hypothetical protein
MRAARAWAAVGLALAAVGATAQPCLACSCVAGATPRQHARRADAVFTGRVTRIIVEPDGNGLLGDERVWVRFRVGRRYKGRLGKRVLIHALTIGNTCGFHFHKGKRYTVFAYRHRGWLKTDICTGTKRGRINPDRYGFDRPGTRSAPTANRLS